MFNNLENELSSFSYVFTKFPEEYTKESIKELMFKINKELNDDAKRGVIADQSFSLVVKDIAKKSLKNNIIFFNPVKDDPQENLKLLVDDEIIKKPSKKMKISFSSESTSSVLKQIEKHFDFIEKALARLETNPDELKIIV
jgi:hypothetical protein